MLNRLASKWDRIGLPLSNIASSAVLIAWLTALSELFCPRY